MIGLKTRDMDVRVILRELSLQFPTPTSKGRFGVGYPAYIDVAISAANT